MSSITDTIQTYLKLIPATPEEIYSWFSDQRQTHAMMKKWGFPLFDYKNNKKVNLSAPFYFSNSPDPTEQTCRCGKSLSLLKKDWYIDDAGCSYHWGRRTFCDGPENGLFSCCKGVSEENGCMHRKYHACSYKSLESSSFMETSAKTFRTHDSTNVFALDTEMVYTTAGLEVARVSLISISADIVYDTFVQPENLILDYNTPFSGVKPEDLREVVTTLADAQASLLKLLNSDTILIGHGLENDLVGLHLIHTNIVDTSLVYTHDKGYPYRHSLKTLAARYLNTVIHSDWNGHSSVEDAKICIALMLKRFYLQTLNPFFKPFEALKKYQHSKPCEVSNIHHYTKPLELSNKYQCIKSPEMSNKYQSTISAFNVYSMPKPPNNYFTKPMLFMNGQATIFPKIIQFQTPVYPIFPLPPVQIHYSAVKYRK